MIFGPVEGRLGRKITPPRAHLPRASKAPLSPRRGFSFAARNVTAHLTTPVGWAEGSVVLPLRERPRNLTRNKIISLRIVTAPATGIVLDAPPLLIASDHSVDYPRTMQHDLVARRGGPSPRVPHPLHELRNLQLNGHLGPRSPDERAIRGQGKGERKRPKCALVCTVRRTPLHMLASTSGTLKNPFHNGELCERACVDAR